LLTEFNFRTVWYFVKRIAFMVLLLSVYTSFAQAPMISSFGPTYGGQSSFINIKGNNFTNATAVSFGGTPAGFFYAPTDSTIVALVDNGSSGAVAVTTANGTGLRPGFTFVLPPTITSLIPTIGGYGDTVIIKGKNYIDVYGVYVGDSSALSFSALSDSVIKAVIGNGISGQVGVDAVGGSGSITGFIHLGPAITSFSPTAGIAGTIVKIKGINFTGTTSVSFGGFPAASFIVSGDTVITAIVGAGGPGEVSVTSPRGVIAAPGFITPHIKSFSPQAGTRGTVVSMMGTNFSGVSAVNFGDSSAASFTVVSDTVLTAIAGNGESGDVRVTKGGLSASSAYFYYYPYQPAITAFAPASAYAGTVVTIRGTHFTGTSNVSFGDSAAASFTVVSDSVITAVVGNGNSGYLFVTNNNFIDSLAGFSYFINEPVISSFSPAAGPAGTTVLITGTGFNASPAANIVYFGAVNALVTEATATSLNVIVPAGATYQPITVANNRLTGYSGKPFIVTFPGAMAGFSALSFATQSKIKTVGSNPQSIAAGDFNNDGKTDLALVYGYYGSSNNTVSVYKNTGSNGFISFGAPAEFNAGTQSNGGFDITVADMDGDGKLDIVALSSGDNLVGVLKNTSSNGNISFAPKMDFVTGTSGGPDGTSPVNIAVHDFDGDGKPDITVANFGLNNWCNVSYIRNTSANGILSFDTRNEYPITDAYVVNAADLNNDKKPDIAVGIHVNGSAMKQVATLNNTSNHGMITFQRNEDYGATNSLRPYAIAFGDLDADGKTDIVTANGNANSVSVFKNISADSGFIQFSTRADVPVGGGGVRGVCISDADGDGKPDIIASSSTASTVSLLKNTSSAGNISFAAKQDYVAGNNTQGVIAADLSGDGKPEIIAANGGDTAISIFKNKIGDPLKLCPPAGSLTITSNLTGNNFQWQLSTNNGNSFASISNNSIYNGATSNTLQFVNIPSAFNGYVYRCVVNGVNSNPYKIQFENNWTGAANSFWNNNANWSCGILPDANTDVVVRSGNVVLNTNGMCRSITILPGATFSANPGVTLTITR